VSTVADLDELHSTVDQLHRKEATMVHSLNQQVTYLRQLDGTVKFNSQAIGKLNNVIKNVALKAQEGFYDVASKLEWYNKQKEIARVVRQLALMG
jgi:L-lysine 2,3-aminomutase